MKPCHVLVFAKVPRAGFAKSRLIPALGEENAARLARRMLIHTISQAMDAGVCKVELCKTPAEDPVWQELELPLHLAQTSQGEGDLGERMARACQRVIGTGASVIIIGTDCPQLDTHCLQQMTLALTESDAVIVPTTDGGYAALGLNRFDPLLFSGIRWSTATVAAETLQRIATLQWSVTNLPVLQDIDEPADLACLPADWPEAVRSG